MNTAQEKLQSAMQFALANRPKVGGFPFLAECLRQAGVERNLWSLPGAQSIYIMKDGVVVQQGSPLISGIADVPPFNQEALVTALRTDQAGESTFPEFLSAAWQAGVVGYEVDFVTQAVSYHGALGEKYIETYPKVELVDIYF